MFSPWQGTLSKQPLCCRQNLCEAVLSRGRLAEGPSGGSASLAALLMPRTGCSGFLPSLGVDMALRGRRGRRAGLPARRQLGL